MNSETDKVLSELGIKREEACSDNQQQNGLAERTIGLLFETARTVLAESRLPLSFWGEAIQYAAYLRNVLPNQANDCCASPYEMRYNKVPDLNRLRPFGIRCTILKHKNARGRSKARERGIRGIFVGYGDEIDGQKGWRVYLPQVVTSPNVLFNNNMAESIKLRPKHLIADNDHDLSKLQHETENNTSELHETTENNTTKFRSAIFERDSQSKHSAHPTKSQSARGSENST